MYDCQCSAVHTPRRIVLTGGPGAGKTAVLELARYRFCKHVQIIQESAGIVLRGGFPRSHVPLERAGGAARDLPRAARTRSDRRTP